MNDANELAGFFHANLNRAELSALLDAVRVRLADLGEPQTPPRAVTLGEAKEFVGRSLAVQLGARIGQVQ